MPIILWTPTYNKIQPQANPPEADSNWPKISIPPLKINIDSKANFRYLDDL
jgi:hypothetical protein